MTATITNIPSAEDRDEAEFDRKECNNMTRLLDDGWALWGAMRTKTNHVAVGPRLHPFAAGVAHLASYRERDNLPVLELEPGWFVALIDLPGLLLRMAGLTRDEARALSRGADICRLFPVAEAA